MEKVLRQTQVPIIRDPKLEIGQVTTKEQIVMYNTLVVLSFKGARFESEKSIERTLLEVFNRYLVLNNLSTWLEKKYFYLDSEGKLIHYQHEDYNKGEYKVYYDAIRFWTKINIHQIQEKSKGNKDVKFISIEIPYSKENNFYKYLMLFEENRKFLTPVYWLNNDYKLGIREWIVYRYLAEITKEGENQTELLTLKEMGKDLNLTVDVLKQIIEKLKRAKIFSTKTIYTTSRTDITKRRLVFCNFTPRKELRALLEIRKSFTLKYTTTL